MELDNKFLSNFTRIARNERINADRELQRKVAEENLQSNAEAGCVYEYANVGEHEIPHAHPKVHSCQHL
ncbi:MAG: hypothetical protein A2014_12785 [Spirochaetes bacterium GWF1_49_6]|nr:MAG: hypothetical protein A2014_12785 [Spirochaetes bacterium GWF1_49_6]